MSLMGLFWIALLTFALIWPFRVWKHKPLGMRVLVSFGVFAVPFGIAAIIDQVPGSVFILAASIVALIAVTYFDFKFRAN